MAIPAFFRFTDVTEFMIGITIFSRNVAITIVEKGEAGMKYNIEKKRKTNKDMDYNDSSRQFRPLGARFKSHGLIYQM